MDENSNKVGGVGDGGADKVAADNSASQNPNFDVNINTAAVANAAAAVASEDGQDGGSRAQQSERTPFTNLSQVDADLALARTLQEQERAYMMLSMNGGGGVYGRWETGMYFDDDDDFDDLHDHEYDEVYDDDDDDDDEEEEEDDDENEAHDHNGEEHDHNEVHDVNNDEEDAFDVHADADSQENNNLGVEGDSAAYPDDEAFARALQDAEEREMAARLLAMVGITEREIAHLEEHGGDSQDAWEEVDPDELSYEELIALGEVVGTESRGLSADNIASLPSISYKTNAQDGESESCAICRVDYEDGDTLTLLPCKHAYHTECISNWLKINKVCPVCSTEVSTSSNN